MSLIDAYQKAKQDIYDHVGFKEDWVVYPIEFNDKPWIIDGEEVRFFDSLEAYQTDDGNHSYSWEIYTQRFYPKWVYEGAEYTMVIVDTHTDGNKFFAIFENAKRIRP